MSIEVLHGNCLEVMDDLYSKNGEFVDFIFADPPYFLSNGASHVKMVKWFMLTRVIGTRARVQI